VVFNYVQILVHKFSERTYGQTGGRTDRPMYVRRSANLNAHPKVCRVHKQSVLFCSVYVQLDIVHIHSMIRKIV